MLPFLECLGIPILPIWNAYVGILRVPIVPSVESLRSQLYPVRNSLFGFPRTPQRQLEALKNKLRVP